MLFNAIKTKNYLAAARLLARATKGFQAPAELNALNDEGNTPLHCAVMENDLKMIKIIVAAGPNFSIKNKQNQSVIDLAKDEAIKIYLRKAEVCAAAWHGHLDLVKTLMKDDYSALNIQVTMLNSFDDLTTVMTDPYKCAQVREHTEVAKYISEYSNADKYDAYELGLLKAVDANDKPAITALVNRYGHDINFKVTGGGYNAYSYATTPTALTCALHLRDIDLIKHVISLGADTDEPFAKHKVANIDNPEIKALFNTDPSNLRRRSIFIIQTKSKDEGDKKESKDDVLIEQPSNTITPSVD